MPTARHGSLRIVLDTNVLISALHFPEGTLSGLWQPLYEERFRLVLSPAIIAELAEKLRSKFGWEEHELQRLLRTLVRKAEIVRPTIVPDVAGELGTVLKVEQTLKLCNGHKVLGACGAMFNVDRERALCRGLTRGV